MLSALIFISMSMCVNWGDHGGSIPPFTSSPVLFSSQSNSDRSYLIDEDDIVESFSCPRGGSYSKKKPENRMIEGGKAAIAKASGYWSSTVGSASSSVKGMFRSKKEKKELKLLEQLNNMPVREVNIPNSTVLPPDVIRMAVKRSGLVGSPLQMERVQDLARTLKQWYVRKGYILNSVTGAQLDPDTATAEITVEEPVVSKNPVDIVFCKEMVIDEETGKLMTFRKYREKKRKESESVSGGSRRFSNNDFKLNRDDLNTTFIKTTGRTKATKIAEAMNLYPHRPFQWIDDRWKKIGTSGVFDKILKSSPEPADDGGVCLQVFVTEPPARHLEYGIGKSVWTNAWEGEVDFDWRNVFGGGESVGILVRRGTKDPSPSVRLRYGDDKFGLEGGYDIEAFSDFLGDYSSDETKKKEKKEKKENDDLDDDSLLSRRGATFRLRNPISSTFITNSVASASIERTSTFTGQSENIGSASLTLGPFRRLLPLDARSSVSTTITSGTRFQGKEDVDDSSGKESLVVRTGIGQLLPYTLASTTTKQILPIFSSTRDDGTAPPITLALQHTVSLSTSNLPRHEARAMGNSAQIRGASADGAASSTVKGSTEIRIPVAVPLIGSGSVVLFGDWFCVQKDMKSPFYSKSSIGIGVRKPVQGLPLKLDLSYTNDGNLKPMFGLGVDFDV